MIYIPIDKTSIPYRFDIDLAGEIFAFEVHYNSRFDYFTVNLSKNNEVIVDGAKIVYGNPLFNIADSRLPKVQIVPIDESGIATKAGYNELGNTVFLSVVGA